MNSKWCVVMWLCLACCDLKLCAWKNSSVHKHREKKTNRTCPAQNNHSPEPPPPTGSTRFLERGIPSPWPCGLAFLTFALFVEQIWLLAVEKLTPQVESSLQTLAQFRKPLMVDWNNDSRMDLVLFEQPFQEQKTCLPMVLEVVWKRLIFNSQSCRYPAQLRPLPKRKTHCFIKFHTSGDLIQVFLGHLKLGPSPRSIIFAAGDCLSLPTQQDFQCPKIIPHAQSFCFFGVKMADLRRMRFWRTRVARLCLSLVWKAWTCVGRAFEEIRGNAWLNNFKVGF